MIIAILFFLPLAVGVVGEYLMCRCLKKRAWRVLLPVVTAALATAVTLGRYFSWSREGPGAPLETLLFFPGVPGLGAFLGLWLGWRLWHRLWKPRVVKERRGK